MSLNIFFVSDLTARDVYSRRCQVLEKKEEERAKMIEKHIKETKRLQKNDLLASWDPTRVYQIGQIFIYQKETLEMSHYYGKNLKNFSPKQSNKRLRGPLNSPFSVAVGYTKR